MYCETCVNFQTRRKKNLRSHLSTCKTSEKETAVASYEEAQDVEVIKKKEKQTENRGG